MAFYGVGLEVKVRELQLNFKLLIQNKGGNGVRGLKKVFRKLTSKALESLTQMNLNKHLLILGKHCFKIKSLDYF